MSREYFTSIRKISEKFVVVNYQRCAILVDRLSMRLFNERGDRELRLHLVLPLILVVFHLSSFIGKNIVLSRDCWIYTNIRL